MSGWFNPANPRFRRGVVLTSVVTCTLTTFQIILADFGSQEHVLSPVQRIVIPKIDEFFGVTADDLKFDGPSKEPGFMKVVSPLLPSTHHHHHHHQQQQQQVVTSSNEQKATNSDTAVHNDKKNSQKRGWLW